MPEVAVRTAAIFIAENSDKNSGNPAALAIYAGWHPSHDSQGGASSKAERVSRSGNKRLKRALFLSAFASIRFDPVGRAYYDQKRAQGERHHQALIVLAQASWRCCSR